MQNKKLSIKITLFTQKSRIFTELNLTHKFMKNIYLKNVWMLITCLLALSVQAQVSPKKFKKAKGIEVTYQSSYKGSPRRNDYEGQRRPSGLGKHHAQTG